MTEQEIFNIIRPWIAEKLGLYQSEVAMDDMLVLDLGADSLDLFELALDIEH